MTEIQEAIVAELTKYSLNSPTVYGLVLIGSSATGLSDAYSDLDFWVTVKDEHEKNVINQIENVLSKIGQIDSRFHFHDTNKWLGRTIFHLKGTPAWHKIEIAIAPLSNSYLYTKGLDAPVKVLVNKDNTVSFKELDEESLNKAMQAELSYLKDLFNAQMPEIQKYCHRNKLLEAYEYYETYALRPLVGALRAVYCPTKQSFYLKHIYQDLPKEVNKQLEDLYTVKSTNDIIVNLNKIHKIITTLHIDES
ncbi:MAG: nucleotidyltransferase domain-containing protein [Rhabdochlamydiaceae bacterium]